MLDVLPSNCSSDAAPLSPSATLQYTQHPLTCPAYDKIPNQNHIHYHNHDHGLHFTITITITITLTVSNPNVTIACNKVTSSLIIDMTPDYVIWPLTLTL